MQVLGILQDTIDSPDLGEVVITDMKMHTWKKKGFCKKMLLQEWSENLVTVWTRRLLGLSL